MGPRFPEVCGAVAQLPFHQAILDGEIVALDSEGRSSFQILQPRMHLSRPADIAVRMREVPAYFVVFDLLYCNGYLLAPLPLWKRKEILQSTLLDTGAAEWSHRLLFSEHIDKHGKAFYRAAAAPRLEGIVAKQRNSPYESKRSRFWLKIKCLLRQEFVVVGFTEPKGSRRGFGSLLLGLYQNGIEGKSFYQKNTPDYFPGWIPRKRIYSQESRRWMRYTLCDSRDALLYLANLACIPHNPWSSRAGSPDHPDFIIFDLDPEEASFSQVREVALKLRRVLEAIGLDSYPKTSASRRFSTGSTRRATSSHRC